MLWDINGYAKVSSSRKSLLALIAYLSDPFPHSRRQQGDEVVAEEYGGAKLLGCGLQTSGHIHIGRKIRGVNLVLASNCALNSPAHMQTEAHSDRIPRHSFQDVWALAVAVQPFGALKHRVDDYKCCQSLVCQLLSRRMYGAAVLGGGGWQGRH